MLETEFGADVNVKNKDENTPLHLAVREGHVEIVKLLVTEFAADANVRTKDGSTARLLVTEFG